MLEHLIQLRFQHQSKQEPIEMLGTIDEKDLPRCSRCQSLLRPHIVWFGEQIENEILEKIDKEIELCDLFLVVRC